MKKTKISSLKQIAFEDLSSIIDTSDSFKYSHLWSLISSSPEIIAFLKIYTRTPYLEELIAESKKESSKTNTDGIEQIELYYSIEQLGNELTCSWQIHGIGYENGKLEKYALDFSPLNNLNDFDVVFCGKTLLSDGRNISEYDDIQIIDAIPSPSILEILDAVIFEASFYGCPSSRDKQMQELKSRIENIEHEQTFSSEEVFEKINNKFKDNYGV